jgi:hypothetical protein
MTTLNEVEKWYCFKCKKEFHLKDDFLYHTPCGVRAGEQRPEQAR